jgi:hypothetical protein
MSIFLKIFSKSNGSRFEGLSLRKPTDWSLLIRCIRLSNVTSKRSVFVGGFVMRLSQFKTTPRHDIGERAW